MAYELKNDMGKTEASYVKHPEPDGSLMGETHRGAALLCITGFFLRIILSDPVMTALGMSAPDANTAGTADRLHPGTYLICLSFLVLLLDRKEPVRQFGRLAKECTAYILLLIFFAFFFIYWSVRDASGVGMLIETHMTTALCAIVLSYAPRSYCRRTLYFFIAFMTVNSLLGIIEASGKFRFFTFPAEWVVLKEPLFRASALIGHPLSNAMLTSLALFIMLATRLPATLKAILLIIFMTSLVAFGGRTALVCSLAGLLPLGIITLRKQKRTKGFTLQQTFLLSALALIVPCIMAGGLYMLINSDMGERIGSMINFQDDSAGARWFVFSIFHYMSWEEIMLGVSTNRIIDIVYRVSLDLPMVDVENPWLLMFIYMGAVFFSVWLVIMLFFIRQLMSGASPAIKLAIITYFIIASTSNSFGRKDFILATLAATVICAHSAFPDERPSCRGEVSFP